MVSKIDKWISKDISKEISKDISLDNSLDISPVSRAVIEAVQLEKLNALFVHCKSHSGFYTYLPDKLESLDDLKHVPFMTGNNLSNSSLLLLSQSEIARVVTTSGTTGLTKRLYFTESDLNKTISFFACGISEFVEPGDRTLIWMPDSGADGLGSLIKQAVKSLGAEGFLSGVGITYGEILKIIFNNDINTVIAMPVPLLSLSRYAKAVGMTPRIKAALVSADACPGTVIREVRRALSCNVYPHYGSREIAMGGAITCGAFTGMHIRENDLLFEIIDDEGNPLPRGEPGELVVTTLSRLAMPLIRYKTGDMTYLYPDICGCGSEVLRMGPVNRRDSLMVELDGRFFADENILDYRAFYKNGDLKLEFICVSDRRIDTGGIDYSLRLLDLKSEKPLYTGKRIIGRL